MVVSTYAHFIESNVCDSMPLIHILDSNSTRQNKVVVKTNMSNAKLNLVFIYIYFFSKHTFNFDSYLTPYGLGLAYCHGCFGRTQLSLGGSSPQTRSGFVTYPEFRVRNGEDASCMLNGLQPMTFCPPHSGGLGSLTADK